MVFVLDVFTSSLAFSYHMLFLLLVLLGVTNRTSTSRYALKYKVDWSSRVGVTQVTVIFMALLYSLMKLLQATVGGSDSTTCAMLCKFSAFFFPMIDFSVYMFLMIRNEKSAAGSLRDNPLRMYSQRALYSCTIITPIMAIVNAVKGDGVVIAKTCVTSPNAQIALSISGIEIFLNFSFLLMFIIPLREYARQNTGMDSKKVRDISMRNFASCLLCVAGGVFTNSLAGSLSLLSSSKQKSALAPFVVLGSIVVVTGVLFSTWKAWEWQVFGFGRSRVVDENGDVRPSEYPESLKRQQPQVSIPDIGPQTQRTLGQ